MPKIEPIEKKTFPHKKYTSAFKTTYTCMPNVNYCQTFAVIIIYDLLHNYGGLLINNYTT